LLLLVTSDSPAPHPHAPPASTETESVRRGKAHSAMDEEEHEVYGQDIPEDGDLDGADVDMAATGNDAAKVPHL
jgi:hypothetical protein